LYDVINSTVEAEQLMTDDTEQAKEPDDGSTNDDMQAALERLELGAEPYWMQDIRCAQRRLEAERLRQRASGPDSGGESSSVL